MKHRTYKDGVLISEVDIPDPALNEEECAIAIQTHIDAVAKSRGYGDGLAVVSYLDSSIPAWKAEAVAFKAWRDAVWAYAYGLQLQVLSGSAHAPTEAQLIAGLPVINWTA